MAEFDAILAVKRAAMLAVTNDTSEFNMREIQRWYSMCFSTRLEDVEALPIEDVCLHYFEVKYKEMTPEDRENEMRLLVETKSQRLDRLRREEDDDEDFLKSVEAEEIKKLTQKNLAIAQELAETRAAIADTPEEEHASLGDDIKQKIAESAEGIQMEFISEEEMDEMGEWDILGSPPPPKKP